MKHRPILLSTPMVQAILEGRKTQIRIVLKSKTQFEALIFHNGKLLRKCTRTIPSLVETGIKCPYGCPYGKVGDILWVRETWCRPFNPGKFLYKADQTNIVQSNRWKPSIHMPKEAARIFLEITNVRVERLQDITQTDAEKEGVLIDDEGLACMNYISNEFDMFPPEESFRTLWQSINGPESWEANPWVWVIEFKKVSKPQNF